MRFLAKRRAQGSTGLGLYIVHNLLTKRLGGRIAITSAPAKGTTVAITLPLQAPGEAEASRLETVAPVAEVAAVARRVG